MTRLCSLFLLLLAAPLVLAQTASSGSSAGAIGAAQSQSTFVNQPTSTGYGSDFSDRAPTIFVPGLAGGTNPCIVSFSAGASIGSTGGWPGFGLSGGRAYTDPECNVRETLRLAASLSPKEPDPTQRMFLKNIACQSKVMAAAMEITAAEAGDPRYACSATLPKGTEVSMRVAEDLGRVAEVYPSTDPVLSDYDMIMGAAVADSEF